jgi:hypothetical protein
MDEAATISVLPLQTPGAIQSDMKPGAYTPSFDHCVAVVEEFLAGL